MLTKWLSVTNTFDSLGVAFARLIAAGRRLRTTGRAARTNGRIWSRTIEQVEPGDPVLQVDAPGPARSISAWLAAGSAFAAGSRLLAAGPSCSANVWTLPSVAVVWFSVAGRSATARLIFPSSEANALNTRELELTSVTICDCLVASAVFSRCSEF